MNTLKTCDPHIKCTLPSLAEGIVFLVVGLEDKLDLRPQSSSDLSRVLVVVKYACLEGRSTYFLKARYTV